MFASHRLIAATVAMLVLLPVMFLAESSVARGTADETPSVTVRYGDLNLNSPQGVATLYARIHAAAANVCLSGSSQLVRPKFPADGACLSHAIAGAVLKVHNDKLSAYHWTRIRGWKSHRILVASAEKSQ